MSLLIKPNKPSSQKSKPIGRYATAEEAALVKNADLIATIKKMNLTIINGQPVVKRNDQG